MDFIHYCSSENRMFYASVWFHFIIATIHLPLFRSVGSFPYSSVITPYFQLKYLMMRTKNHQNFLIRVRRLIFLYVFTICIHIDLPAFLLSYGSAYSLIQKLIRAYFLNSNNNNNITETVTIYIQICWRGSKTRVHNRLFAFLYKVL